MHSCVHRQLDMSRSPALKRLQHASMTMGQRLADAESFAGNVGLHVLGL